MSNRMVLFGHAVARSRRYGARAASTSVVTSGDPLEAIFEPHDECVLVRLRHRAPLIPATFDGEMLRFKSEVKRPASGQSAVIYDGEICLGGGIIA